jgi:AraC-like DNA-binding protein
LVFKQTNLEQLSVQQFAEYIQIVWGASYSDYREMYELNLALIFKIAQSIVQDALVPPQKIQFGYLPHTALYHYEKFYGCLIHVQAGQYAIRFSNQILKAKSIAGDQQLNHVLSTQAQQSLNSVTSSELQQQQFRQKIQTYIEQGLAQQEEVLQSYVAKRLHCSERTLQRQLKAYQLNFQDILDQYRLEQSKLYLQQGKSLSEIAERLNYADQSAFGRAFKRWTGVTPKQFLKSL